MTEEELEKFRQAGQALYDAGEAQKTYSDTGSTRWQYKMRTFTHLHNLGIFYLASLFTTDSKKTVQYFFPDGKPSKRRRILRNE